MKSRMSFTVMMVMLLAVVAGAAMAGTGGTEFDGIYTTIHGWMTGTLGKIIAVASVLVGLSIGVAKQSIMAVVIGIAMAVAVYYTPTVIESVVIGALPL